MHLCQNTNVHTSSQEAGLTSSRRETVGRTQQPQTVNKGLGSTIYSSFSVTFSRSPCFGTYLASYFNRLHFICVDIKQKWREFSQILKGAHELLPITIKNLLNHHFVRLDKVMVCAGSEICKPKTKKPTKAKPARREQSRKPHMCVS